jgi:hypothetical protein
MRRRAPPVVSAAAPPTPNVDVKSTTTVTLDGASTAAAVATRVEKMVTGAIWWYERRQPRDGHEGSRPLTRLARPTRLH